MIAPTSAPYLHRPFERLHAAERSAGDGAHPHDAKLAQQRPFDADHVGNGNDRKVGTVRTAGLGVHRRRTGRPTTAAEKVRADHEKAFGVERLAGTDHAVPPAEPAALPGIALFSAEPVSRAGLDWRPRETRRVGVAAQGMADEHDVIARRRQRAVGLVRDPDAAQFPAAVQQQRLGEVEELRLDRADRAGGRPRRWRGHRAIISPEVAPIRVGRNFSSPC